MSEKNASRNKKERGSFNLILSIIFLTILFGFSAYLPAATFHVTTGAEFQSALSTAQSNGESDTIYLAAGTYDAKTDGTYGFDSSENYDLTVTHESGVTPAQVILDGGNTYPDGTDGVPVMRFDMKGSGNMVIDGITIQNGYASAEGWDGGGLWVWMDTGSLTIRNCIFQKNGTKSGNGGGLMVGARKGSVTLLNNTFQNNTADHYGGGVHLDAWGDTYNVGTITIKGNVIQNNTAASGGGFTCYSKSPTHILGNTVENNTANGAYDGVNENTKWYGGGAFKAICFGSKFVVKDNIIRNNIARNRAGGMYLGKSTDGNMTVANNLVVDNTASDSFGGGIYAFGDNEAGGGPYTGSLRIVNNTVYGNTCQKSDKGGGIRIILDDETWSAEVYNNIVYGNTANGAIQDIYVHCLDTNGNGQYGTVKLHNNDYTNLTTNPTSLSVDLKDNINLDPKFLSTNDYHLQNVSPCIDAGDNNAPDLPDKDLDGNDRIVDGNKDGTAVVDMGAYEAQLVSAKVSSLWPINGAQCGHSSALWAQVWNIGVSAFNGYQYTWYYVDGPNWSGSHFVGYAWLGILPSGSSNWFYYNWAIPTGAAAGSYYYWARVYDYTSGSGSAISDWKGPQAFTVSCGGGSISASVTALYPVNNAQCGQASRLWAQVKNTGASAFNGYQYTWYYVDGPSWSGSHFVGYAWLGILPSGSSNWFYYNWAIPTGAAAGSYYYWARVYDYTSGSGSAISDWKGPQTFTVTCH